MDIIDTSDNSLYMNPASYSNVKDEKKLKKTKNDKLNFNKLYDSLRGKTSDEIGPLLNLPVSEETINFLKDEVNNAGDILLSRPFPDEVMKYKKAVRNFLNYVVKNGYSMKMEKGIPASQKPGFTGQRGTPEAMEGNVYIIMQVVDRKLEDLAANLLSGQMRKLELVSRIEEIRGLLIDLLH